jgi:hypothetical protein
MLTIQEIQEGWWIELEKHLFIYSYHYVLHLVKQQDFDCILLDPLVKPFAHLHKFTTWRNHFTSKCTSIPMSSNNINIIIECRYSRFRSIVMFKLNSHLTTKYFASIVSTITLAKFSFTTFSMGSCRQQWLKPHNFKESYKLQTLVDFTTFCCKKKNDMLWSLHFTHISSLKTMFF